MFSPSFGQRSRPQHAGTGSSALICGVEGVLVPVHDRGIQPELVVAPRLDVAEPVQRLSRQHVMVAVGVGSRDRLDRSLRAAALDGLYRRRLRVSVEDVWPMPDGSALVADAAPSTYSQAVRISGVPTQRCLVVESSESGVRAASAAGLRVVGLLHFVPPEEHEERAAALRRAGAYLVVRTWTDLERLHAPRRHAASRGHGAAASRPAVGV